MSALFPVHMTPKKLLFFLQPERSRSVPVKGQLLQSFAAFPPSFLLPLGQKRECLFQLHGSQRSLSCPGYWQFGEPVDTHQYPPPLLYGLQHRHCVTLDWTGKKKSKWTLLLVGNVCFHPGTHPGREAFTLLLDCTEAAIANSPHYLRSCSTSLLQILTFLE